jgi:hypothetical protein
VPELLKIIVRVVEQDLAPSILVFYCIMGLGEFYVFAAVLGYLIITFGGLLVFAYKVSKTNPKMIKTFRILIVVCTFLGFLNIFIDDMIFIDADPNRLMSFAYPGSVIDSAGTDSP